jgi:hypothetical protein
VWAAALYFHSRGGVSYEKRRETTEQPYENWYYSRVVGRGRDFGPFLYALSAMIIGMN